MLQAEVVGLLFVAGVRSGADNSVLSPCSQLYKYRFSFDEPDLF